MSDAMHPPAKPNNVRLKIRFDVDQETDQLSFKLHDHPKPVELEYPNQHRGRYADGLFFETGSEMSLRIIGGGARDKAEGTGFEAFQIIDCAIITRPQVALRAPGVRTQWSPPSPFVQSPGPIYSLPLHFTLHKLVDDEDYLEIAHDWKPTLNVGFSHGMWDLSFMMTVRISRSGGQIDQVRVLMFDPEAEVGGTGTIK